MSPPFRNLTILAELHEIGQAYGLPPAQQCDVADPHAAYCLNHAALLAGLQAERERRAQAEAQAAIGDAIPVLPEAEIDQDIDLKGLGF